MYRNYFKFMMIKLTYQRVIYCTALKKLNLKILTFWGYLSIFLIFWAYFNIKDFIYAICKFFDAYVFLYI